MTETLNSGVDRLLRRGPQAGNTLYGAAAAVAAIALVAFATPAQAEVRFTVTNLGTLGGTSSVSTAINAAGQVAGYATLANGRSHATRWTGGVPLDLGAPVGNTSLAYAINESGQIAGDSGSTPPAAVFWGASGPPTVLSGAPGPGGSARGINDGGSVVGYAQRVSPATGFAPVLWRNGQGTPLNIAGNLNGFAAAINNAGQIAGQVGSSAALWVTESASVRLLPGLGGTFSYPSAINAAGVIAGTSENALGRSRAVVWQFGGVTDLGSLGGTDAYSIGLNDRNEVVGLSTTATGANQGFFYSAGQLVNLNTLLAPGSGANISSGNAINAHGQIAATATIAGQTRAVLLTPSGSVAWQAGAGSANGSFTDATRWEQGFVPSKFVDASIDSAGLQTVFVNQAASVKNLTLGANAGSPGRPTMLMTGGTALQVAGLFTVHQTGTLAGDGTVAGNLLNRGAVLPANLTITGSFSNQGVVAGSGTLNAALANASTGQVRTLAGETLRINGTNHSNAGVIDIRGGGEQQYSGALANAASGRILLNDAVLRLDNGATNAGQVQVSFGGATVYGSLATTTGGKVILSGNSQTTFFDAVSVDSGGELRVSNGSTGVFFGPVTQRTGALFTGTGTKFFEGGLLVGASPGLGLDAGSVNFGVGNLYTAEIGGSTACTAACETNAALRDSSFDKYIVSGHLALGGTLKLVSWAGFTGQIGQSFDLFDWGSSSGAFSSIDASGLALAPGAILDFNQLNSAGIVSITAVPEPATWALLLCGLGLVARRWRSKRQAT